MTRALLHYKCEALKTQADCGKEAKCQFKDNKCSTSEKQNSPYAKSCGAFLKATLNQHAAAPEDACNKKDKTGCTDTCKWQEIHTLDDDKKKCKVDSKCVTRNRCPSMTDAQKDVCNKKADYQAKVDCFIPICVDYVWDLSYMTCSTPKDVDSCKKAAPACAWDDKSKKCAIDAALLYSSQIPDECAMKPMFLVGNHICAKSNDKAGCDKEDKYKCKWGKQYSCDKTAVKSSEKCKFVGQDEIMSGLEKDIMGAKLAEQGEKCVAAKAEAACGDVEDTIHVLSMGAVPAISTFATFLVGFLVAP